MAETNICCPTRQVQNLRRCLIADQQKTAYSILVLVSVSLHSYLAGYEGAHRTRSRVDYTKSLHSHTPRAPQGWCHDHTENGDGAAHPANAVRHSARTTLGRISIFNPQQMFINLPTCSAFSQLRFSFEALSESGKRSSSPARPIGSWIVLKS